jgi:IS5 family transposase
MYSIYRVAYLKHKAASHGTAKGAITPIVIAAAAYHGSNSSSADSIHDDGK